MRSTGNVARGVDTGHGRHLLGVGTDHRTERAFVQRAAEPLGDGAVQSRGGREIERLDAGLPSIRKDEMRELDGRALQ